MLPPVKGGVKPPVNRSAARSSDAAENLLKPLIRPFKKFCCGLKADFQDFQPS